MLQDIREMQRPPQMRDPRMDRVKVYLMPLDAVLQLLNAHGDTVPKVEGWVTPEDEGVILGYVLTQIGEQAVMAITVHSPKFPIVLTQPPVVPLTGEWRELPEGVTWDSLAREESPDGMDPPEGE